MHTRRTDRRPIRFTPLVVAAVLAVLLAACGSSATTPQPTASPTPAPTDAGNGDGTGSSAPGGPGLGSLPFGSGLGNLLGSFGDNSGSGQKLCALVTNAEVETATGGHVVNTDAQDDSCTWTLDSLSTINLRIDSQSSDLSAAKLLFPGGRGISGLGDNSWWGPTVKGQLLGSILYFTAKGKTLAVQLVLFGDDDATNEKVAETVARAALGRY